MTGGGGAAAAVARRRQHGGGGAFAACRPRTRGIGRLGLRRCRRRLSPARRACCTSSTRARARCPSCPRPLRPRPSTARRPIAALADRRKSESSPAPWYPSSCTSRRARMRCRARAGRSTRCSRCRGGRQGPRAPRAAPINCAELATPAAARWALCEPCARRVVRRAHRHRRAARVRSSGCRWVACWRGDGSGAPGGAQERGRWVRHAGLDGRWVSRGARVGLDAGLVSLLAPPHTGRSPRECLRGVPVGIPT